MSVSRAGWQDSRPQPLRGLERLAVHGPSVLVAVAGVDDPAFVVWKPLKAVLADYWMTAFPDEIDAGWTD